MRQGLSVFLFVALGCAVAPEEVGSRSDSVVYGSDDRVEVYAHPDPMWRDLATRSIVALVPTGAVDDRNPSDVRLLGRTLQQSRGLCSSERFLTQPTAANCSGTLIDLDLVLTAGHCVSTTAQTCSGTRFVFDYLYESDGTLKTINSEEDVYSCSEVVVREVSGGLDYAVVRLDRLVHPEHLPAPVRMGDLPVPPATDLVVMGFGSGIPLKIDDGGEVINSRSMIRDWFGANLDTFGGHSGSGVFNDMGEVVGILVRGEGDYEYSQGCGRVRVLPNSPGPGVEEECTYVARAIEALCAVSSSALCMGGGTCQACRDGGDCGDGFRCDRGACLPTCEMGEPCPSGTACDADGLCQPEAEFRCEGSDIVETRCGRNVGVVETCGAGTYCDEGACAPLPPGDTCDAPIVIEAVDQTLTGEHIAESTSAGEGTCAGRGRDTVYEFELTQPTRMVAHGHNTDAVLHLRTECESQESEVACNDDAEGPVRQDSVLDVVLEPGRYYLFMDNFSRRRGGEYVLMLMFEPIVPPMDAGVDGGFDAGPGFDSGPGFDAGPPPFDAGPPPFDGGMDSSVVPPFDSGIGFDSGPGFDAGPRTDAGPGVEVELLEWGCDCGVANPRSDAPLGLLVFAGLFVWRRRRAL